MKLWLSIIVTLIVQELVMTNAVLLNAYQQGYSVILISLIFIIGTIIDIVVGYSIGKFVQRRFHHRKIIIAMERRAHEFQHVLGSTGYKLALVFLGFVNLNYINAFLASWSSISFRETLIYLFLGDILWYAVAWLMILGVSTFINPFYAIYFVLGLSLIFTIVSAYAHKRILRHA